MEFGRQLLQPVRDAVGLERPGRPLDELRELQEQLDERQIRGLHERARVDVGQKRRGDPLLRRLAEDRANARVRVLHVVDGVVVRLARRDREVELERAVVTAREEREPGGVAADLLEQFLHEHELAPSLGHPHGLPVAQQRDELDDQDLERLGRVAERLHRRADPRHVPVMIGAEQVDQSIGRRELHVVVIGDVHREVGRLAVRASEHAVLVVAGLFPLGRAEPEGAVLLVAEATRRELLQHLLRQAFVTDVALLGRPDVELDGVVAQDPALRVDHPRDRIAPEMLDPLALGGAVDEAPALVAVRLREIDEVLAGIAILGERGRLAELLLHACLERARERLELIARVVDVELGRDVGALRPEQPCEGVAHRGCARVDDDQRAGRVRRDELHADAAARLALTAPVRGARGENLS